MQSLLLLMYESFTFKYFVQVYIELFINYYYSYKYMSDVYVAWRKVIRHIFRVPYRTRNDIVIY